LANDSAKFGLAVVLFFLAVVVMAPVIAPHDPLETDLRKRLDAPNLSHPFGRDELGRDVFSRVIYGTRPSLMVGVSAVLISILIGCPLGLAAGYFATWVDSAIMRLMDIMLAFPAILLAIAIVTVRGPGLFNTMIAIGIVGIPAYARLIRSSVLSIKNTEYIVASRCIGAGNRRILFLHILPNAVSPIIVQATLSVALAIVQAAGLGFLGLGAQPPAPEWGAMLSSAYRYLSTAPWIVLFVGAPIALAVLGLNLLGDGLRDALDPQMTIGVSQEG
jgi:peptide/nickel transport system permease protein